MRKAGILLLTIFFLTAALAELLPETKGLVTIDVVRTFSSSSYDGFNSYWLVNTSSYALVHDHATGAVTRTADTFVVGQTSILGGSFWAIYRMMLFFDTSTLPDDCTIINATLQLYLYDDQSDSDFNITLQNGQPTYPHTPIQEMDYGYTHYSGNGGAFNTSGLAAGYNNLTVSATGLTWISTTGYTKLCARSNKDISSISPAGDEWVSFWTTEKGEAYSPKLIIGYETEGYQYIFYGAYNEEALRDGAINCTVYKQTESPENFELDGSHTLSAELIPTVAHFDIGYNESRTYHLYLDFEEIYVIKPTDPYYTYYFSVVDFIGLEWGYLESLVNLNGTDTVCERQTIAIMNNIPFTFSWGRTYKMRLVCNLGEYVYGVYVAGATTEFTLVISKDMFPEGRTDIGDLTVSATRMNASWIQCIYIDANSSTTWVHFAFHEFGNATAFHTYNTTSNSVTYNWYEGFSTMDYFVIVRILHENLGLKTWTFTCPADVVGLGNPFIALRLLGDFPFDPAQIPAVAIIIVFMAAFSWWNAPLGIIVTVLVAFALAWLGWLAVGWTWLATSGSMGFILALAMKKDREPAMR